MEPWSGQFELVDPRLIVVDHSYQRGEKDTLIATIARSPDWAAFGAISLYRRQNGVLVVVDGQQRLLGVMASSDPPKRVPAVIHAEASVEREADTFVSVNVQRKTVDPFEKHRGKVRAKHPDALAIERAIKKAGFSLGTGDVGRTVHAVAALYYARRELGEEGVVQVLTCAREAWPDDPAGVSVHMIKGICQVLVEQGAEYNRGKVTSALAKSSPAAIIRRADGNRFDYGDSKQKNVRRAIKELCKI